MNKNLKTVGERINLGHALDPAAGKRPIQFCGYGRD
jgi:hypothetical protein